MIGDLFQYWCGRRLGRDSCPGGCQISFSPDFCVSQTETLLAKVGPVSLLFSKFLPGFAPFDRHGGHNPDARTAISAVGWDRSAAIRRYHHHLRLDVSGRNHWRFLQTRRFGLWGLLALLAAFALYLVVKWLQRQLFIRSLRMSRISVNELRRLMDEGEEILLLDVRPADVRAAEGIIPGAVPAHPAEIKAVGRELEVDESVRVVVLQSWPGWRAGLGRTFEGRVPLSALIPRIARSERSDVDASFGRVDTLEAS